MTPYWDLNGNALYQGHVLDVLRSLPAQNVHCIVTSPPYWGLRDYGLPPVEWPSVSYAPMAGLTEIAVPAWAGCLGLEPTVEAFVGHLVLVTRELRRVLRDDGTFWLNLGSSYQDKQEMGIPWRVAFALQADGWICRSTIIWAKGISFCKTYSGSCMPESVKDRPTTSYEHVFLLAKSKRYFYDGVAVKEKSADPTRTNYAHGGKLDASRNDTDSRDFGGGNGRNLRTVWAIGTGGGYKKAHFATYPPALVEPMIKAGASEKGCCSACGAPWQRVIEREKHPTRDMEA